MSETNDIGTWQLAKGERVAASRVKCAGCSKSFSKDSPEAEFIGWHGECASCNIGRDYE